MAVQRFPSQRGIPSVLMSDSANGFKAAFFQKLKVLVSMVQGGNLLFHVPCNGEAGGESPERKIVIGLIPISDNKERKSLIPF